MRLVSFDWSQQCYLASPPTNKLSHAMLLTLLAAINQQLNSPILVAGITNYETNGCSIKHKYQCPKISNLVMATVGIFYSDQ